MDRVYFGLGTGIKSELNWMPEMAKTVDINHDLETSPKKGTSFQIIELKSVQLFNSGAKTSSSFLQTRLGY